MVTLQNKYSFYQEKILPQVIKGLGAIQWFTIDELQFEDSSDIWKYPSADKAVEEGKKNRLKLADEILVDGIYWPFIVRMSNGKPQVLEGGHRITALKERHIVDPITRKFMCILINDRYIKNNKIDRRTKLPIPLDVPAPIGSFFSDSVKDLKASIQAMGFTRIDDDFIMTLVTYAKECLGRQTDFVRYIRNDIYDYNQSNEENFKGSTIFNDYNASKEWTEKKGLVFRA